MNILVLDGLERSSLAAVRSFGKAGFNVTCASETSWCMTRFSKYCDEFFRYPDPSDVSFSHAVLKEISGTYYDMILPMTNRTLLPLMNKRRELEKHTIFPFPKNSSLECTLDKYRTIQLAEELGVPHPKTELIESTNQIQDLDFEYLVAKPVTGSGSRGIFSGTKSDIVSSLRRMEEPVVVQEFIPRQKAVGAYLLYDLNHEVVACTVQERIRSYPSSGGPSTLRKTVKDDTLMEFATKLLDYLEWIGVAMVEFRYDSRDGIPKLMEINPRFWGSLALSIAAGVDFPVLLYKVFMKEKLQRVEAKPEVMCRWFLPGDILHYLSSGLRNPPVNFFSFRNKFDILSREDFGPTIGFITSVVKYIFDRSMWKRTFRKGV